MSENVLHIQQKNFDAVVMTGEVPVVVDFWAPWCGPCRMLAPELEKAATRLGSKAKIVKVNTDENPDISAKYGISSIPTIMVFHNGKLIGQHSGYITGDALAASLEDYVDGKN